VKKFLVILVVLGLIMSIFAGCGQKGSDTSNNVSTSEPAASSEKTAEQTPAETPAETPATGGDIKMLTAVTGGKDEEEMKLFAEALGLWKNLHLTTIML